MAVLGKAAPQIFTYSQLRPVRKRWKEIPFAANAAEHRVEKQRCSRNPLRLPSFHPPSILFPFSSTNALPLRRSIGGHQTADPVTATRYGGSYPCAFQFRPFSVTLQGTPCLVANWILSSLLLTITLRDHCETMISIVQ